MLVISSDAHRLHHSLELDGAKLIPSWDSPDRADIILTALIADSHEVIQPDPLDVELVVSVHSHEYVEFLRTAWCRWQEGDNAGPAAMGFAWPTRGLNPTRPVDLMGQLGFHSFAADCSIVDGTWTAASTAAAIAQTAADRLSEGSALCYGLCRPPGHHASVDQFGGYCYLNNAAVAAQRLLDRGANRVAVLDVDYHHGNGTQSIFYHRSDVLFISIHADPRVEFPWFAGHAGEVGGGEGHGWNTNLPLPHGTDIANWGAALNVAVDRIDTAGVDALVVSLGVDTFRGDPISKFRIETSDYPVIAGRIAGLGLPTLVVQEGGYAVEAIGANVGAFLNGLA